MTTKIELGLGAVRECDLDLTIGELHRLGTFIQQCMEDEREACATLEPEPLRIGGTDAEPEYGTYDEVFLLGWEAYRRAIRARGEAAR